MTMATVIMCIIVVLAFSLLFMCDSDAVYVERETGAIYRLRNIYFIGSDITYELENVHTGEIKQVVKEYLDVHFNKSK